MKKHTLNILLLTILIFIFSNCSKKQKNIPQKSVDNNKQSQDKPAKSINFVAWNLHNYTYRDRTIKGVRIRNAMKPLDDIRKLIAYISKMDADILGVCEIGSEKLLTEFRDKLKKKGHDFPYLSFNRGNSDVIGLGILSKFKITNVSHKNNLTYRVGKKTRTIGRGILDVKIKLKDDFDIRVLGVHLKSKYQGRGDISQEVIRQNEAELVYKYVNGILNEFPKEKLILYGDFNALFNEPAIEILINKFHNYNYREDKSNKISLSKMLPIKFLDKNGQSWTHYWKRADVYSRIDYVFINENIRKFINMDKSYIYHEDDFHNVSDHRALIMNILLNKKSSSPPPIKYKIK